MANWLKPCLLVWLCSACTGGSSLTVKATVRDTDTERARDAGAANRSEGGTLQAPDATTDAQPAKPTPADASPSDPPVRSTLLVTDLPEVPRLPVNERKPTRALQIGGQSAYEHDDGDAAGYFHTFDAFTACEQPARKVHVFVPRDESMNRGPYPVLYMNDGQTAFWPASPGSQSWQVAATLSALRAQNMIPKLMVVAIHPLEREQEYTPNSPRAVQYAAYVADCVKPFIDQHYPTAADRKHTGIVGSSRGGLAAFFMGTRHPDAFGFVGSLSGSYWALLDSSASATPTDNALADSPLIQDVLTLLRNPEGRPRLWVDWGLKRDGGDHNAHIEALATARGHELVQLLGAEGYEPSELYAYEDPEGGHDEAAWALCFPSCAAWFAEGWTRP